MTNVRIISVCQNTGCRNGIGQQVPRPVHPSSDCGGLSLMNRCRWEKPSDLGRALGTIVGSGIVRSQSPDLWVHVRSG